MIGFKKSNGCGTSQNMDLQTWAKRWHGISTDYNWVVCHLQFSSLRFAAFLKIPKIYGIKRLLHIKKKWHHFSLGKQRSEHPRRRSLAWNESMTSMKKRLRIAWKVICLWWIFNHSIRWCAPILKTCAALHQHITISMISWTHQYMKIIIKRQKHKTIIHMDRSLHLDRLFLLH